MKTFIAGTVGACLLLPIGAGAQADPPHIPPITAKEPRFKLEALRFKAINETGLDVWPLSDEVKVLINLPDNTITVTQLFGDVDAGEKRDIPLDQSCILPIADVSLPAELRADLGDRWSCSRDGAPGPFSFLVQLREIDEWLCPISLVYTCEVIGQHEVVYSMEELIALQVGQVLEESVRLRPCIKPAPQVYYCAPWEAEYQFTWRLTRLPDAEPVVGPISRLPDAEPVVGPTPF
jgi:hypothetical protein